MVLQVVFDGGFEVGDAAKHAAADGIGGDQPEEALDLVEPRGGSRREVEMKARMAFQPCFDLGMLVGGVVVDHQMEVEGSGRVAVDAPQEAQEFLVTMARHALADDLAGGDIERGKQRRCAVALVVMCSNSDLI